MKLRKKDEALFRKIEAKKSNLSNYVIFQDVCKTTKFGRFDLEQHFFALVDPVEYELSQEEYESQCQDAAEFQKEYPSVKDFNERVQNELAAGALQWKGEGSRIPSLSVSFLSPMTDEARDLRRRLGKAKIENKKPINPYF